MKKKQKSLHEFWSSAGRNVKLSMCVMGLGQLAYGQIGKGLLYMGVLALGMIYFIYRGGADLIGLFTLGTKEANTWLGI